MEIKDYVEGISKSTFCKPELQQKYISLAHFISLQPRECMFVKDNFYPNGMVINGRLYYWMPTPGKGKDIQRNYAIAARECIDRLVNECPNFSEVIIDVRNNIGGILSTFINAILPILCWDKRFSGEGVSYLRGVDNKGKQECEFKIEGNTNRIILNDESLDDELIPIRDSEKNRFAGKKIHIICNRYTMSSGEIMCIIVRLLGGKIYGEHTRGLTNGCKVISRSKVKKVLIPYYTICDGNICYANGVDPDYTESQILKLLQ